MRSIIKNVALYAISIFLVSLLFSGVKITGGIATFIVAGVVLSILKLVVTPILHILTLPLNIASLGAFTFIINAVTLYLLTVFVSQITITAFTFPGFKSNGVVLPPIYFNTFFAYIITAFFISGVVAFIRWIIDN